LLERSVSQQARYRLIAATCHADVAFTEEMRPGLGPYDLPTNPRVRDPNWRFLGFDVTDGGFISGLSNCGYTEEERRILVSQWGARLNSHHLFDDIAHAFAFRSLTNQRVAEHAPFFVIGQWQIREVGRDRIVLPGSQPSSG
jgi:hypothetical protein